LLEDVPGGRVGLELLAFLNADRAQLAHGDEIPGLHRLIVHHARQAVVEAVVEAGDAVEQFARHVDVALRRGIGRLRQRIHARLLHQIERLRHVRVRRGRGDGAQDAVAVVGIEADRDVSCRDRCRVARG
jgi:hypothetical protein